MISKHKKKTQVQQSCNDEMYLKPKQTKCYYMIHNNTNHKNNNNSSNYNNKDNKSKFIIKDNELAYMQNIINSNQNQIQTNIQFEYNNNNTQAYPSTYDHSKSILLLFYEILPKLTNCVISISHPYSSGTIHIEICKPTLFDIVLEVNDNSDLVYYYPKTMNINLNEEHLYLLVELEIFKADIDKLIELVSIYI